MADCYKIENSQGETNFLSGHLDNGHFNLLCFVASINPNNNIVEEINRISNWNTENNVDPFQFHVILLNKNSLADFDKNICILVDPVSEAHNKYGAKGECINLIRPDGYTRLQEPASKP